MIILFGLAGSGKGTQSNALAELFGWRWISTGNLIRNSGDEHLNSTIADGNMISDADMEALLEKELDLNEAEGFDIVLDGFPRTEEQAEWLLNRKNDRVDGAIVLDVPKDELYNRLYMRAGLDGRVDDQEKTSIERRFEIFEQNIYSILNLFEAKNIPVIHVDGLGAVNEVTARVVAAARQIAPAAAIQKVDVNNPGPNESSYGE